MQYATQTNYIRHLSANHYRALKLLCQYSNNLYSKALYQTRQPAFNEGRILTYETNYHLCKTNDIYKMLQAEVAKHTMKVVAPSLRAFPCIIGKMQERRHRYSQVVIPHYRTKRGHVPTDTLHERNQHHERTVQTVREQTIYASPSGHVKHTYPCAQSFERASYQGHPHPSRTG